MKEKILESYDCFDDLFFGEAEVNFAEYIQNYPDKSKINGIVYRDKNNEIITNNSQILIENIDELPYPIKEISSMELGYHPHFGFSGKTASMITSRGCPYKCTFCSSGVTMGKKFRFHSVEYVLDNLEELNEKHGFNNIVFWDDVFTLIPERLQKICQGIIQKNIKIKWYCLSKANLLTPDIAKLMKSAGCAMISFGIESGNTDTLDKIQKHLNLDDVRKAVSICDKTGIKSQCTFILGFPFERKEEALDTIKFAKTLPATFALFFSLIPYPNTDIYREVFGDNLNEDLSLWQKCIASEAKPESYSKFIDSKELKDLIKYAHNNFYFRLPQIIRILKHVKSFKDITGYLKLALELIKRT
jgi:radical SAM superfamily enzyme YgiQ (UPF0313 family)